MTAPTKSYTAIPAADVAANKAILTTTGVQLIDNDEHLKQVLYQGYTPAQAHDHDGVNSALVRVLGAYDFTDTSDVAIGTGTAWSTGQSIVIPTNGIILLAPTLQINVVIAGSTSTYRWGLSIGGTAYYPTYVDDGTVQSVRISVTNNQTDDVRGGVYFSAVGGIAGSAGGALDVADLGIATGAQTVQPVIDRISGSGTTTLKGTVRTSRMKVLVFAG